jgi:hypothetical protein
MQRTIIQVCVALLLGACGEADTMDTGPELMEPDAMGPDVSTPIAGRCSSDDVQRLRDCVETTCANATDRDLAECVGTACAPADVGCAACAVANATTSAAIAAACGDEEATCGENESNACGSCGPFTGTLGAPCACGGSVATACDEYQQVTCEDGNTWSVPVAQPDTTDAFDDWTAVTGTLEAASGSLDIDTDVYAVWVDDTIFGVLSPQIELDYETSGPIEVCVTYLKEDGALQLPSTFLTCTSENSSETKAGLMCCLQVEPGSGTFKMDVAIDFGVPNFTDGDGTWRLRVGQRSQANGYATDSCERYTLRYRF